jgi:hypothetical protein
MIAACIAGSTCVSTPVQVLMFALFGYFADRNRVSVWPLHLEFERLAQDSRVHVTSSWTHGHFGFC